MKVDLLFIRRIYKLQCQRLWIIEKEKKTPYITSTTSLLSFIVHTLCTCIMVNETYKFIDMHGPHKIVIFAFRQVSFIMEVGTSIYMLLYIVWNIQWIIKALLQLLTSPPSFVCIATHKNVTWNNFRWSICNVYELRFVARFRSSKKKLIYYPSRASQRKWFCQLFQYMLWFINYGWLR